MSILQPQFIAGCWDAFSKITIPEDASSEQVTAMRAAFYAGASTALKFVPIVPDVRNDEHMKYVLVLATLNEEVRRYFQDLDDAVWTPEYKVN